MYERNVAQPYMVRWVRGTSTKYQIMELIKLGEFRLERFYCNVLITS
jgi:hypothetical protein